MFLSNSMTTIADYHFQTYSVIMLVGFILAGFLAFHIRKYARNTAARYLLWTEVCVAEWSLAYIFESAATTIPLKLFWSQIAYLGTMGAPVFFFFFAISYSMEHRQYQWQTILAVSSIPLITLILAFTNSMHQWIWSSININPSTNLASYGHGTWFWINTVYIYFLLFIAILHLLSTLSHFHHYYSLQSLLLIVGCLLPFMGNFLYLSSYNPIPGLEWTPLGFILSGLLMILALFRYGMFDLIPVARDKLLDIMQDGVLVLDEKDRIMDMNPGTEHLFNIKADKSIGKTFHDVFQSLMDTNQLNDWTQTTMEVQADLQGEKRTYDVKCSRLLTSGSTSGRLIVFRDITRRINMQNEREKLISELQDALAQVKTLKGMLPICARCKKIRNDSGYWQNVEHYVQEHSDAVFSHAICPDCLSEMYPEYMERREDKPDDESDET